MNKYSKYTRSEAKWILCAEANPCASFKANSDISLSFVEPTLQVNITGNEATLKTVTLYCNTNNTELFSGVWNIYDSISSDSPVQNTGVLEFRGSYVTESPNNNRIIADLNQYALDMGASHGDIYSFTFSSRLSNGDCDTELVSVTENINVTGVLPVEPTNVTLINGDTEIGVGWFGGFGATQYVVSYRLPSDVTFTEVIVSGVNHILTGLINDSVYQIKVKSRNEVGDSIYSPISLGLPEGVPVLSFPLNIVVTGKLFGAIVEWDSVEDSESYLLEYKLSSDSFYTQIVTTSLSYDLSGVLSNGVDYDFRIASRNSSLDSEYSDVITVSPFDYREVNAERHYIFGNDNNGYVDINGTNAASKLGTGHSQSSGYVSTLKVGSSPYLNGIQSNVVDKSTNQTLIIVGKMYNDVKGAVVMGNISTSGSAGGISTLEQHTGSRTGDLFIQNRGTTAFHYIEDVGNPSLNMPTGDEWFFFAHTLDGTGRRTFYKDSTMSTPVIQSVTGVITPSSPSRPLGWGNISYISSGKKHGINIAEGMIFQEGKTTEEIQSIYDNSVNRMSLRGISI